MLNYLINKLICWEIIKEEDKDLYTYGFSQGCVLIFNFASVILIGLTFGMLWQSIVFMMVYGLLRPLAGGYHARTQRNCYLFSISLIIVVLFLIKHIPWNELICLIILLISSVVIFLLAPVEDENKPLDKEEQIIYKKRTRIILLLLVGLSLALLLIKQNQIAICTITALATLAVILMLGKVKNVLNNRN